MRAAFAAVILVLAAAPAGAQRPRPYPVFEPPAFQRAVERGTRTRTGHPGPRYWQQWASYRLEAELDPPSNRLRGRAWIRYENRSPDTLRNVFVHLNQNLFAPDAVRNEVVPVTRGMELERSLVNGVEVRGQVTATVLRLPLAAPLLPGASLDLEFAWSFLVPPDGAPRGGQDGEVFVISYWYPQLAVYDDFGRWQTDPYLGNAEFYMGYADYDAAITVPEGWLVAATGTLANPEAVFSDETVSRLRAARASPAPVHVVTEADFGRATRPGRLTYRFRASGVRDFTFATSSRWRWDATLALAGPDTADIHTFYRPSRIPWAWDQSARYARHSIEFLSRFLWPYPYPQMTAVDGVASCGGMEYPMLTCIGGRRDTLSLYSVIVHEFAHMWFPMQVGSDERRYSWQDEGLTRFNQAQAMREFFGGYDLERIVRDAYLGLARAGAEVELMRHGDLYPFGSPAFAVASYQKMATILAALRALLGEETFLRAYREYGRRWVNRHPSPYDFWNTFEDVSGRDLDWFWRTWFFETWTLDHAVAAVTPRGGSTEIVIEDRGLAPMPARLTVTRPDGSVERLEVPVGVWLNGARSHSLRVRGRVARVEIDPEHAFPDIERANNVWPR
jgi:hypothetical protein